MFVAFGIILFMLEPILFLVSERWAANKIMCEQIRFIKQGIKGI